jgi:uncharacterized repeat protein (TIGR01451 family)
MFITPSTARSFIVTLALLFSQAVLAQDSTGSAYGESVDLSIDSVFSLVTVEAQSGPLPSVTEMTPPAFAASDSLLSVDVNANVKLISNLLPATTVGILETGVLNVETSGDQSPAAASDASVADVNLEILGTVLLPLVVGIQADAVTSSATAAGTCGDALTASGASTLVNASLATDLAELADVEGSLVAIPPPNFELIDLDLLGGHIRLVLNEQIPSGDGVTSAGITVNAIHLTLEDLPIAAIITDVSGDVIISQSTAAVTCAEADLAIDITDSPDPVTSGQPLTYTLAVDNNGPDTANGVTVEHLLPAGVTFDGVLSSQGACNQAAGVIDCDLGALSSGGSATITVTVTPNAVGQLSTSATVAGDVADPNLANNSDTEQTTVVAAPGSADLSVGITDSPDPVTAGDTLTITLDIGNAGPDDATNTTVSYLPPAGIPVDTVTPSQGSCMVMAAEVTCALGTVANGATPSIVLTMTPLVPGVLLHEATVVSDIVDPDTANNTDTEDTTVVAIPGASADLSILKSDSPDPVVVGQPLTYTLTISNGGPDGTNSVVVTDTLPAGLAFQSATASQGSCDEALGTITCNLGAIASGEGATITIVVIPGAPGLITNTAVVTSDVDDPDPTDNSDSEDTQVDPGAADLAVTKTSSVNPGTVDVPFTYTVSVVNEGPDDATQVQVLDTLPAGLIFGSALPSQGSCSETAGTVTCDLGTVPNQGSATIAIEVTPTAAGTLTNVVTVDSEVDDPDPSDNTFTHVMDVGLGTARFVVMKDFTDDNPAQVVVTLTCDTGLPLEQSFSIAEGEVVAFVVTQFESGTMDCVVTEEVVAGYLPDYFDGTSNNDQGCEYTDIAGAPEFSCQITNTPDAVDVTVDKLWETVGASSAVDMHYQLTLYCDGEIVGGSGLCLEDAQSCLTWNGEGPGQFVAEVVPNYPSSVCWVVESVIDNSVEVDNGCQSLVVSAGTGDSCTITNTVFFEGIPALDRYGLALLILTVFGIGLVAVRRVS